MSNQRPNSDEVDRPEPGPQERAAEIRPDSYPNDGALPETVRSASRSDVIRYAAASRDFNPLHWDHEVARNAGLPGTVVHGLLSVSWMLQVAVAATSAEDTEPIREAKFRFRNPLLPGQAASISGEAADADGIIKLELSSVAGRLVSGSIAVGE
jgi:acyl dehydratase